MPGSKRSSERILGPDEQRAIAAHLVGQRQEEDALRALVRGWPVCQRRPVLALINYNRRARMSIWHILDIAEETLWPTSTKRSEAQ